MESELTEEQEDVRRMTAMYEERARSPEMKARYQRLKEAVESYDRGLFSSLNEVIDMRADEELQDLQQRIIFAGGKVNDWRDLRKDFSQSEWRPGMQVIYRRGRIRYQIGLLQIALDGSKKDWKKEWGAHYASLKEAQYAALAFATFHLRGDISDFIEVHDERPDGELMKFAELVRRQKIHQRIICGYHNHFYEKFGLSPLRGEEEYDRQKKESLNQELVKRVQLTEEEKRFLRKNIWRYDISHGRIDYVLGDRNGEGWKFLRNLQQHPQLPDYLNHLPLEKAYIRIGPNPLRPYHILRVGIDEYTENPALRDNFFFGSNLNLAKRLAVTLTLGKDGGILDRSRLSRTLRGCGRRRETGYGLWDLGLDC